MDDEFKSIVLINRQPLSTGDIESPKDVLQELATWALREEGQTTIDEFFAQVKKEKILSSSGLSKARGYVNDCMRNPWEPKSNLVAELEVKTEALMRQSMRMIFNKGLDEVGCNRGYTEVTTNLISAGET